MPLTLQQIAKELARPRIELLAPLREFEIPTPSTNMDGSAQLGFLRLHSYLRLCQIPQNSLLQIWQLQLKLMRLLHLDSLDSPTWMIAGHLKPGSAGDRSLLLSRARLDAPLTSR